MDIKSHRDLDVFKTAMDGAVAVHQLVRRFPRSEQHILIFQLLKCSKSVPANLAEAWRKRAYSAHFVSKLSDVQGEAAETQVWLEIANRVGYMNAEEFTTLFGTYETILAQTAVMARDAHKWTRRQGYRRY